MAALRSAALDKKAARQLSRNRNCEAHFAAESSTIGITIIMKGIPRWAVRDAVSRKGGVPCDGLWF